ncbi:MAG: efflux RND transporter periplasmic adaptor subunit [Gammaproteobacteria bacterium]|nr:efflux RND transporter periplasmic adaptor subunit [Gammaproteobacteria bacterium]
MSLYWRRRLIWLAILAIIVAALIYGFRPQPRLVDVAETTHAPLQVSVEEEGKTRVIDRYIVSAPVAGTTCRVNLDVGNHVEKEQSLISIEPLRSQALDPRSLAEAQSQVAAADSALRAAEQIARSAQAETELARKELSRLQPLAEIGHISQDKLDQAATLARITEAKKRSAEFAVDVAHHELEAARTALQYTGAKGEPNPSTTVQVRAPVTGRVLKIHQECEGVIAAGHPLLEIGDTQSLEIETDVLSSDAVKIKPGMRVIFIRWGGEKSLEGLVRIVEPVGFTKVSALGVEEQRVLVISDITSSSEQWQNLGDSYRVEARFILWERDNVLQIPASALFHFDDGWAVFVMDNKKARRRTVEVGQRNGLSAQILGGLTEGEKVITHPDDTIDDGVAVKRR